MALVDVVAVREWRADEIEAACASAWEPGWLAWELINVRPVNFPQHVPARLRIYEVSLPPSAAAEQNATIPSHLSPKPPPL